MPTSTNRGAGAYATGDPAAYPWGWLAVVVGVIVMMITGARWLYQKNGEWRVGAADNARSVAPEHLSQPAIAAAPQSTSTSAVDGVSSPSDIFSASTPTRQPDPAIVESSAGPDPPTPVPPTTVDAGAERSAQHVGSASPAHAAPLATAPILTSTYTIRRNDTLMAIAAHRYGDASQWRVIARENPEADPRRLRVGQEIKLPPRPSQSR